ncbi:T9SS type A sorting domain-containing protein [Bacteroidales bacterium OttesenSCG-928-B11]|nr:T9SS type A sorting domain-containing protein [Bacteroidales bacterium OttesenSCG-928-E04]MDL2308708.1 T9SS type A sorting domain-containing protein [Bacteroidales bacterium OttesenSCG-928-C03]MDL2311937.1 T9SS type A sorting domain-containing protein [Bacteroidales bacterium OttesenSCG-928-B11]
MKKVLLFSTMLLFVALSVSAQHERPSTPVVQPIQDSKQEEKSKPSQHQKSQSNIKNGSIIFSENFDSDIPSTWTNSSSDPNYTWAARESIAGTTSFSTVDSTNIYSACVYGGYTDQEQDHKLISPSINVSQETELYLQFYCGYSGIYMIGGMYAGTQGADMRVLASINNGATWTQMWSYSETHAGTEAWEWGKVFVNFSQFAGESNLKIAFQYTGKNGDDGAIDNIQLVTEPSDDLKVTLPQFYTMVPASQAYFPLSAIVTNQGSAVTDAVNVDFSITPGTFSHTSSITNTIHPNTQTTVTTTSNFSTSQIGDYSITAEIDYQDDDLTNNIAQHEFAITPNTLALDQGNIIGRIGFWMPSSFGNVFEIFRPDTFRSIAVGFPTITVSNSFTLSIFSVSGTRLTHIYTSGNFTKTPAMSKLITEFNIPDIILQPGKYFVCINQLDQTNIDVACEQGDDRYSYYMLTYGYLVKDMGYNIIIRLMKNPEGIASIEAEKEELAISKFADDADFAAPVSITGFNITGNITATTTAPFQVSLDSVNFSSSVSLPRLGGKVYVKYNSTTTSNDQGTLTVTAPGVADTLTISLLGSSFDTNYIQLPYFEDFEGLFAWTVLCATDDNDAGVVSTWDALSGSNVFRFFSGTVSTDYSQYLISMKLPEAKSNLAVEFYYKTSFDDERFMVGYSMTNKDVASFTWRDEQTATNTQPWTLYRDTIPAGAKYFAIKYTSDYRFHLDIDDIKFSAASGVQELKAVSHYPAKDAVNVPVHSPVSVIFNKNITITDPSEIAITPNVANVSAMVENYKLHISHDDFEPETTYTITIPSSAIEGLNKSVSWSFTTEKGNSVNSFDPAKIKIYPNPTSGKVNISTPLANKTVLMDIAGKILANYTLEANSEIQLNVAPGIYLLRIEMNDTIYTRKIVVQ